MSNPFVPEVVQYTDYQVAYRCWIGGLPFREDRRPINPFILDESIFAPQQIQVRQQPSRAQLEDFRLMSCNYVPAEPTRRFSSLWTPKERLEAFCICANFIPAINGLPTESMQRYKDGPIPMDTIPGEEMLHQHTCGIYATKRLDILLELYRDIQNYVHHVGCF